MSYYPNAAFNDAFKSHLMNQPTDYFDTRSLDRERESRYASTPSSKSSMSSNQSTPMSPASCERGKSTFSQLTSDRIIASWHKPETGSLQSRSRTLSQRQSSSQTHTTASTRPGTPMVVPTQQPVSKRSTLPSSFKLAAIVEPPKMQRRQTTLRAAGLSICEDRAETHIPEDW